MAKLYLIGDSILDNYADLKQPTQDLTFHLKTQGYNVQNYAYDNTTVSNLLAGVKVEANTRTYPYNVDPDGKLRQLDLIDRNNGGFTPIYGLDKSMIVLSIGGNNFKVGAIGNSKMLFGTDCFFNSIVDSEFRANHERIIQRCKAQSSKVVLISMYLPFLGPNASYGVFSKFSKPIIDRWLEYIRALGLKYNLPVLDLSRTLDCYNRAHYGITDIKPSDISTACIAKCIAFIYENYNGYNVYYAPDCQITDMHYELPL